MFRFLFSHEAESSEHQPEVAPPLTAAEARRRAPGGRWWDRSRFLTWSEEPNKLPCPDPIDITGRERFLFCGPYVKLAPGRWRATIFVHVSPDAARRRTCLLFGGGPRFTEVDLAYGGFGNHCVAIDHSFKEGEPAEIRMWLRKAAFFGAVRLIGACVKRLDAPGSEAAVLTDSDAP